MQIDILLITLVVFNKKMVKFGKFCGNIATFVNWKLQTDLRYSKQTPPAIIVAWCLIHRVSVSTLYYKYQNKYVGIVEPLKKMSSTTLITEGRSNTSVMSSRHIRARFKTPEVREVNTAIIQSTSNEYGNESE